MLKIVRKGKGENSECLLCRCAVMKTRDLSLYVRADVPVSGRDRDTIISGEPLQYNTKSCDPRVRVTTLMRCRVDENWNW
jgi:hypothetical protein